MKFSKLQGTGNDFIVIDDRCDIYLGREEEIAKKLCDRHFSIGADGILIVRNSNIAEIQMIIINADGSYASMCGNGIRCFAKYVWDHNIIRKDCIKIETGDGIKEAKVYVENNKVKTVKINMGSPSYKPEDYYSTEKAEIINKSIVENDKEYSITSLQMGVPHTVIFGELESFNIEEGKKIEKNTLFPKGTNVNFCEIIDKENVKVKTWERGAGPTLACGTGSSAVVSAANKLGLTETKVQVLVPGGTLCIEIENKNVFMTGPAEECFRGEIDI